MTYHVTITFRMESTSGTTQVFDYIKALATAWTKAIGRSGDRIGVCVQDLQDDG